MSRRRRSGIANWLSESTTPVFVLDERRVVLFFNRGCETLTGWAPADVVGRTCDYAIAADPSQVESLTGALCPPPEVFEGVQLVCPVHLRHREGHGLELEVHYFPLTFAEGEPLRIVGTLFPRSTSPVSWEAAGDCSALHVRLAEARARLWEEFRLDSIIAESPAMRRVLHQVRLATGQPVAVHLTGPSGVGREFLARTIHYQGPQRIHAFVPVDCAALPAFELKRTLRRLLETPPPEESDAPALRPGAVFLRNVTSLPRDVQQLLVDLLPVSTEPVRLFSSESRPLSAAVEAEALLPELAYLLTPLVIDVPALRNRPDDLPLLGQFLMERINRDQDRQVGGFTPEAWDRLRKYQWPGNVKELQQVIAEAHAAARGPLVTAADLPFRFRTGFEAQQAGPPQVATPIDLEAMLHEIERREIRRALQESRFNKSRAAELLGLTRPRLYRRMEQLGIEDAPTASADAPPSDVADSDNSPTRVSSEPRP